jgi:hypothetical protein
MSLWSVMAKIIAKNLVKQRTTAGQVSTNCQIFPIKSVLYDKVNKVENLLVKFDSFV